jgi:hypothetical protein
MKKKLILIAVCAAATLLAQGGKRPFVKGPGTAMPEPGAGRTISGAPYSGVEVVTTQRTLTNGNSINRTSQSNVFRDGMGRTRVERTIAPRGGAAAQTGQSPRTFVTINDPVGRVMRVLDPQTKTAQEFPLRGGRAGAGRGGAGARAFQGRKGASTDVAAGTGKRANNPNVVTENLAMQTINGVQATGVRTTRTIPAGQIGNAQPVQIVHEVWTSLDLKIPVMVKTTDPRNGTTTRQLTNITRAEPDPALFQAPSDYTVTRAGGRGMRGQAGRIRQ